MTKTRFLIPSLWLVLTLAVPARAADVLLTLPFENVSGRAAYNWVGESFVVLYGDLLETPGLQVFDPDERDLVYERLGLQRSAILTRAAVIRVAEAAQANLALVGTYDIGGDASATSIAISARLIEVATGRLVGNKVFNFSGLLSDLQGMQGQLAWNILFERNRATPINRDQLLSAAKAIPARAFESYVKGIQTQDAKLRESLLKRAAQEHGGRYPQAVYELGLLAFRAQQWLSAAEQLRGFAQGEPRFREAQFYLGLAAYNLNNYAEAAAAFERLSEIAPLGDVLNNAGASRFLQGDKAAGLVLLRRALAHHPQDAAYRFNLGYASWKAQQPADAVAALKAVVEQKATDGEALFLLAKSLEAAGQTAEAAKVDDQAKRHLPSYARWVVAPDKMPALFRLKTELPRAALLKAAPVRPAVTGAPAVTAPQSASVLEQARQYVANRNDGEALVVLQRLLTSEPANAEAHYLRGVVLQRRNETEPAIAAYQAAARANPRYLYAHLALSRIYLARKERAQALAYARQALEIEPQNREALALKQQIETGR